ncbi:unnamed protein product [Triticum turgidum subsp. durum]|uniref:Aquaporin n=1 Tax=Triticum turgidum subsp. durum TaxID=4567 RepID=A0A9R0RF30_TRITD|nr:unnamed protein product [Triticum turgidum subsp. durum]
MPKIALGHRREASDPGCLRAVLGELVLTFLFVFVGVGSAIVGGTCGQCSSAHFNAGYIRSFRACCAQPLNQPFNIFLLLCLVGYTTRWGTHTYQLQDDTCVLPLEKWKHLREVWIS